MKNENIRDILIAVAAAAVIGICIGIFFNIRAAWNPWRPSVEETAVPTAAPQMYAKKYISTDGTALVPANISDIQEMLESHDSFIILADGDSEDSKTFRRIVEKEFTNDGVYAYELDNGVNDSEISALFPSRIDEETMERPCMIFVKEGSVVCIRKGLLGTEGSSVTAAKLSAEDTERIVSKNIYYILRDALKMI